MSFLISYIECIYIHTTEENTSQWKKKHTSKLRNHLNQFDNICAANTHNATKYRNVLELLHLKILYRSPVTSKLVKQIAIDLGICNLNYIWNCKIGLLWSILMLSLIFQECIISVIYLLNMSNFISDGFICQNCNMDIPVHCCRELLM